MPHTTTTDEAAGWDTTYLGLPPVFHPSMNNILGRIHVSTSNLAAVREAMESLDHGRAGYLRLPKTHRRYFIAAALQHHAFNRAEYQAVMRGKVALLDAWKPRYFFDKSDHSTLIA